MSHYCRGVWSALSDFSPHFIHCSSSYISGILELLGAHKEKAITLILRESIPSAPPPETPWCTSWRKQANRLFCQLGALVPLIGAHVEETVALKLNKHHVEN